MELSSACEPDIVESLQKRISELEMTVDQLKHSDQKEPEEDIKSSNSSELRTIRQDILKYVPLEKRVSPENKYQDIFAMDNSQLGLHHFWRVKISDNKAQYTLSLTGEEFYYRYEISRHKIIFFSGSEGQEITAELEPRSYFEQLISFWLNRKNIYIEEFSLYDVPDLRLDHVIKCSELFVRENDKFHGDFKFFDMIEIDGEKPISVDCLEENEIKKWLSLRLFSRAITLFTDQHNMPLIKSSSAKLIYLNSKITMSMQEVIDIAKLYLCFKPIGDEILVRMDVKLWHNEATEATMDYLCRSKKWKFVAFEIEASEYLSYLVLDGENSAVRMCHDFNKYVQIRVIEKLPH